MKKAEFAWASIASADPEPVELIEIDGRKGLLTIGCADPFWLDDPLVVVHGNYLERPKLIITREKRVADQKAYEEYKSNPHRWRGPR